MTTAAHYQLESPPDGIEALADVLSVCAGLQSAIAIEVALDRLLHDLPWRMTRADYPEAAAEVVVLVRLSVRARRALAIAGAPVTRRVISAIWSWYSGFMLWGELVRQLAEELGHSVIGETRPLEINELELQPWEGTLSSILDDIPDGYVDKLATDAQRFLAAWWTRLCQRLAFRDGLTAELE